MNSCTSMENALSLHVHGKLTLTWLYNSPNKTLLYKSSITKPSSKFPKVSIPFSSTPPHLLFHRSSNAIPHHSSTKHTTLLVETFHEHRRLKSLLQKLSRKDSSPSQILRDDGDWSKDQFWAVVRFLKHAKRFSEILQVFDIWKNIEKSRINELNYEKIIGILCEDGLIEEALLTFQEMSSYGLRPSLEIYNFIIHGFARKGKFEDAMVYLNEMKGINLMPDADTYDGLIEAYGKYKMYDEIGKCLKKMKSEGCSPDHITYNLLIQEFSRAGLLKRMERLQQTMHSKRMHLQSSTLVAMLEAYANFGVLGKMETVYRRILNSNSPLKEDLIRKLAGVYIENYMFSRLDDLGIDLSSRTGMTDLVWCLRLLSPACLLSQKGMESIVKQMEEAEFPWTVTVANIMLLAYSKMNNFTRFRVLLSVLTARGVKPDIVTVGILFDSFTVGFDGTGALETWRRMGFLNKAVEMNTDPLVLTAFGKGHFLRTCEEMYTSLEPEAREQKIWTYNSLINLVSRQWKVDSFKGVV